MTTLMPAARKVATGFLPIVRVRRPNGTFCGSRCGATVYADQLQAILAAHVAATNALERLGAGYRVAP